MNRQKIRLSQAALFFAAICLQVGGSWAQPGSKKADNSAAMEAEAYFFSGFAAYRKKDFFTAIQGFQAALSRMDDPALLYNIARSHERAGDALSALDWYNAYLKTGPVDVSAVQKRISRLRDGQGLTRDAPKERKASSIGAPPRQAVLEPLGHRWLRWGLFGASVSSLGVSLAFGLRASDAAEKSRNGKTNIEIAQWEREADFNAGWSDAFLITGVVSASLVTYLIWSDQPADAQVEVSPSRHGASVLYRSAF